jgi:hypothetical protein
MRCKPVNITYRGRNKSIIRCEDVPLESNVYGKAIISPPYFPDIELISNKKGLPKEYVIIHEDLHFFFHDLYPQLNPYEIEYLVRREADKEYERLTGNKIDTTTEYLKFLNLRGKTAKEDIIDIFEMPIDDLMKNL